MNTDVRLTCKCKYVKLSKLDKADVPQNYN